MGSLQGELVRAKLADPTEHKFDLGLQAVPAELQAPLRRLKSLEGKFPSMTSSTKLLLALQWAAAVTVEEKKASIGATCDYLETL
jgi:hypothetical protein